jgi:hypothetical protein
MWDTGGLFRLIDAREGRNLSTCFEGASIELMWVVLFISRLILLLGVLHTRLRKITLARKKATFF